MWSERASARRLHGAVSQSETNRADCGLRARRLYANRSSCYRVTWQDEGWKDTPAPHKTTVHITVNSMHDKLSRVR